MRDYPAQLECDVVTSSGTTLHLRPIRPNDADQLVTFHLHTSPGSIYRRYFSFHPELSEREVEHLTRVDYVDRLALIIEDAKSLVAVGRYDRIPGTDEAEVAFLVTDRYQHLGLGMLLLEHLAAAAWPLGITAFTAETQVDNRGMMSVFEDSGFPVSSRIEDEIISVRFPIEPTEEYVARCGERHHQAPGTAGHRGTRP